MQEISFRDLVEVNQIVNTEVRYRSDPDQYGLKEYWNIPLNYGDCEDYALKKRQLLIDRGVRPDNLKLATCWTETGEYHAVLIVSLLDGDYVLDNRYKIPAIKQDMPYTWDKIQIKNKWYRLS